MTFSLTLNVSLPTVEAKLGDILTALNTLLQRTKDMAATLDDVVAKVAALSTVEDSVVSLLTSIKAQLDAAIASGDMTKVQAVADALDAQKQKLADAVTANTPTPPTP